MKYPKGIAPIKQRVLQDSAHTSPIERQQAFEGKARTPLLTAYLKKVHEAAYQVTDEEVQELLKTSSEDELFELTIAASLGAAEKRLEAGLRVIESLED
jgi:hypothetical protein